MCLQLIAVCLGAPAQTRSSVFHRVFGVSFTREGVFLLVPVHTITSRPNLPVPVFVHPQPILVVSLAGRDFSEVASSLYGHVENEITARDVVRHMILQVALWNSGNKLQRLLLLVGAGLLDIWPVRVKYI